jgi:S1-C subfamily serine protease
MVSSISNLPGRKGALMLESFIACVVAMTVAGSTPPPQPRAWLGAGLVLRQSVDGDRFLHVENIAPRGPAAKAGLQPLDIITALNGKKVAFRNEVEFLRFLATLQPGRMIELQVRRAEKSLRLQLIPGELTPEAREVWMTTYRAAEAKAARSAQH